jgi:hypothetical protein
LFHQSRFLRHNKADYEFSGPFAYLKHQFRQLVQIAFLNAQNAENALEWPFDIMKHLIIYIRKEKFQGFQKSDY